MTIRPPWIGLGGAILLALLVPFAALWPWEGERIEPYSWPKPTPLPSSVVVESGPVPERMLFEAEAVATAETAAPPVAPPVLLGIARALRGKAVVVLRMASGEERNLAVGETAEGWTLVQVGRNEARFTGPAGDTVVRFDFANRQQRSGGSPAGNDGNGM